MAQYTGAFLMLYFVKDIISIKRLFKPVGKYLISSLIMFSIILVIFSNNATTITSSIIIVVVGGVVYLTIIIIIKDENLIFGYKFIKKGLKAKASKNSLFL
ncbi:polysaccharide biosynthesis C-terminal domain-containing protein [Clostridium sp.]|uniref:polysaccharide biosynthesis C-terminal domain-containing protein n=1 Tax=Clostridium sp. TaxID=1506 RepID=UPI003D6DA803